MSISVACSRTPISLSAPAPRAWGVWKKQLRALPNKRGHCDSPYTPIGEESLDSPPDLDRRVENLGSQEISTAELLTGVDRGPFRPPI